MYRKVYFSPVSTNFVLILLTTKDLTQILNTLAHSCVHVERFYLLKKVFSRCCNNRQIINIFFCPVMKIIFFLQLLLLYILLCFRKTFKASIKPHILPFRYPANFFVVSNCFKLIYFNLNKLFIGGITTMFTFSVCIFVCRKFTETLFCNFLLLSTPSDFLQF